MKNLYTIQFTPTNIHTKSVLLTRVILFKKLSFLFICIFLLSNLSFATPPNAINLPSNEVSKSEIIIDQLLVTTHSDNFFRQDAEGSYLPYNISFNNNQESDFPIPVYVYTNISNNPYLTAKKPNL